MSDSGDYDRRQPRLLRRHRFMHSILGHGKVADMMLWKNKTASAATLVGLSAVWLVFEGLEYPFVTLLCHLLIILMLLLLVWNKLALLANWAPPNVHDFQISESTFRHLFDSFNWLLFNFFEVSSGHDFKLFAMVMGGLWLISAIGELANTLNLIYIVFVSLQTVPFLYDKYEEEANQLCVQLKSYFHSFFHALDSNVLSKIPRKNKNK
ncbi:reticulon-like protein B14 [Momordica charantia]|uniref:Reticulon-like protein n=1 Tax=Momordica charantia TaxID=3673 RepID=A0A6J1DC54_MOMCH|nr:reticulon-like protein B14 [Momordica charantia]